jgi:hypothetical protein
MLPGVEGAVVGDHWHAVDCATDALVHPAHGEGGVVPALVFPGEGAAPGAFGFQFRVPALVRPASSEAETTKSSKSSWPTSRESPAATAPLSFAFATVRAERSWRQRTESQRRLAKGYFSGRGGR